MIQNNPHHAGGDPPGLLTGGGRPMTPVSGDLFTSFLIHHAGPATRPVPAQNQGAQTFDRQADPAPEIHKKRGTPNS